MPLFVMAVVSSCAENLGGTYDGNCYRLIYSPHGRTKDYVWVALNAREAKMSYSHDQRRKTIRRLKKKYGEDKTLGLQRHGSKWRAEFEREAAFIRATKDGPCLGSLQDLADAGLLHTRGDHAAQG